jgi:uncharacterized protein YyaL (SSP411 family)
MKRTLFLAISLLCTVATAAEQSGGWRLADESSPYLQLHAENPVEWYPWGEAALAKARRENKPLFISIGYFTCHWCHVMARESFSNPAIAKLLNEHFVAIKIDREQRPDLDAVYMQYVQMTAGLGGWPMSVWATPDGKPFLGGTYYPPESVSGRPGFRELLQRLAVLWREDEDGIRKTGQHAVESLTLLARSAQPVKLTAAQVSTARRQYRELYDELQGGFGTAPKFPQPARLLFLLEDTEKTSRDMALHTLERMIAGGIHDRLGGGFHRYSTDFEWRLPHFEKMLYDQALVARACLTAWRVTRREPFAGAARGILDFSLRALRHPQGGFYSALGADSPVAQSAEAHMQEGAYYTWDWSQLTAALGEGELLDWASARYGMSRQGNALHDPLGEMEGRNILVEVLDNKQLGQKFDVDLLTVRQRNAQLDRLLRAARDTRPAVPVDDKVVTVWNGYMITTLALAGRLLDEPRYLEAAERAAEFVLENLYDEKEGVLYRDWRDRTRGVAGFNEDYAGLAEGLLTLHRVTGERRWLKRAQGLVDRQVKLFWDDMHGGFYNTTHDRAAWLREKQLVDGASVSDNSVSIHVLLALGQLTGRKDYTERARQTAEWAAAQLDDMPAAMPYALRAWPALLTDNVTEEDKVTD